MRIVLLASQVKSNAERGKVNRFCCYPTVFQLHISIDLSKFLVIGGYSYRVGGVIDTVEVVDLSSDNLSCSPVANYPRAQDVAAGNIVEGRPRVCGGSGGTTDLCFEYNYEENQWEGVDSLITPLSSLGGSLVNSATWLLSGGYTGDDYVSLTQVRGLDDDEFRSGPTMPRIFSRHCQVTVDPNTVMVLGGYNGTDYDPTVYNLDLVDENWYDFHIIVTS